MVDIAKSTGVSVATVARVIHNNGYVSAEKKEKIQKAIEELGYTASKKEVLASSAEVIGVLTSPNRDNPFFTYLPHALAQEANRHGMYTLLRVQQPRSEFLEEVVTDFIEAAVCGIVIVGFEDAILPEEQKNLLLNCGVPVVFMERTARSYGLNRVLLDGGEGVYLATRHLIQKGHRHFLYITCTPTNDVDKERMQGYKNALAEIGIKEPPIVDQIHDGGIAAGYECAKIGLKRWPETTAIVGWSDLYAIGAMQYCFDTHRRIPQDIAITGFDDICAPFTTPPLTSVKMPLEEMAQAAVDMVIQNMNHTRDFYAKTVTLCPRLSIRQSTGM